MGRKEAAPKASFELPGYVSWLQALHLSPPQLLRRRCLLHIAGVSGHERGANGFRGRRLPHPREDAAVQVTITAGLLRRSRVFSNGDRGSGTRSRSTAMSRQEVQRTTFDGFPLHPPTSARKQPRFGARPC